MIEGQVKKQGGIQPGTTAYDSMSKDMDKNVKIASHMVYEELKDSYPTLEYIKKLTKEEIPGGIGSCEPDGGIWKFRGQIFASIEGKKQNEAGNAGQRWYQNVAILRELSSDLTYITFGSGSGCELVLEKNGKSKPDGSPYASGLLWDLHFGHSGKRGCIDEIRVGCNNYHKKVDGFTVEELVDIIRETIISHLSTLQGDSI